MQMQFCWIPGDQPYNINKAQPYFFLVVFAQKIEIVKT
jgi:hypothetical protein